MQHRSCSRQYKYDEYHNAKTISNQDCACHDQLCHHIYGVSYSRKCPCRPSEKSAFQVVHDRCNQISDDLQADHCREECFEAPGDRRVEEFCHFSEHFFF